MPRGHDHRLALASGWVDGLDGLLDDGGRLLRRPRVCAENGAVGEEAFGTADDQGSEVVIGMFSKEIITSRPEYSQQSSMQKGMIMRKGAQIHVPSTGRNTPPKKTNTQNTPQEIIHTSGFGCRPSLLRAKRASVSVRRFVANRKKGGRLAYVLGCAQMP